MNQYVECKTQQELDVCCKNHDIAIVRQGIFTAWENSQVTAWGNSQVTAWGNSQVTAWGNSQVTARGNSQVTAWENSQVTAWENSQVTARGNSQVTAWENSQVTAYNYSQIRACDYSIVHAKGYNALTQNSEQTTITKTKNCTLIKTDKVDSIESFIKYYPVESTRYSVILYKAVKPDLTSFYTNKIEYPQKGKIENDILDDASEGSCANGLHFSHFDWAVRFGQDKQEPFVILKARIPKIHPKTKLPNIVVSSDCDGKLRCKMAETLEVITDWQHYKP
jgi:phage gp45-like